jgi:hypothetical protein
MKSARTSFTAIVVSLFALQGLAMTAPTVSAHAINTKGTGCNNGKGKTSDCPVDASAALSKNKIEHSGDPHERWVPALQNGDCPKGSEGPYERSGDKCWVD